MDPQNAHSYLSYDILLAAGIGFLIGAIVFYLIGKSGSGKNHAHNPLRKPYDDLKAEYAAYRENVNSHFSKTADAVDNLTKSYQDVFTHLSSGAEQLMDKAALTAAREKRQGKAVTLAYLSDGSQTAIDKKTVVAADNAGTARPAEAAKPAVAPKPAPKAEAPAQQPAPVADLRKSADPKPLASTSAAAPETAEKTPALQAAEKAGLTPKTDDSSLEGIEAVKRHIRENQKK